MLRFLDDSFLGEIKMKKIFVIFALFIVLTFVAACGGSGSSGNSASDGCSTYKEYECRGDASYFCGYAEDGSSLKWYFHKSCGSGCDTATGKCNPDSDESDSGTPDTDNPDTAQEQPDDGDSTPDSGDSEADDGDTGTNDDNDTSIPDDNTDSTLPECSKSSGTPCYDSTSHLTWSKMSSSYMTYTAATTFCQGSEMNGYGGFTDWRLPNIDELKTLLVWSKSSSCKVSEVDGHLASSDWTCSSCTENCSDTGSGCGNCSYYYDDGRFSKLGDGDVWLWSSSLPSDSSSYAWFVVFSCGALAYYGIDYDSYVRCVR